VPAYYQKIRARRSRDWKKSRRHSQRDGWLLLLLAFGVGLVAVLGSGLGVLLGIGRMFLAFRVIALAVMLCGGAMRFRRIFMVFGCLVVLVFSHVISSDCNEV
jgi:uncharacterized membrane protein